MSDIISGMIGNGDPVNNTYQREYLHLFLGFCSYVCIVKNKKMNLPNIFLWLLREKELRDTFKMVCDVETDYDVLKCFLKHDPTLYRSKYIRNYIQANPDLNLKF